MASGSAVTFLAVPGESVVISVQCISVNGARDPVALALIKNTDDDKEYAIYVFGLSNLLYAVIPILDTTVFKVEGVGSTFAYERVAKSG